jgi:hypothetical protein
MHISRSALLAALVGLAALAPSALASEAQSVDTTKTVADWTGPVGTGANTSFLLDGIATDGTCGDLASPDTACDATVVHVTGIVGEGSTITFRIDGFLPISDFDLRVYTADAEGNADTYLDSPTSTDVSESSPLGSSDPRYTSAGDYENKVVDVAQFADAETGVIDQHFVVQVPYFLVASDSYAGHATLDAKPFVAPEPEPEFED